MKWRVFVDKDADIERSIREEFHVLLHLGLFNVDLSKNNRVASIVYISLYFMTQIIVTPLSILASIFLIDHFIYFSHSFHLSLLMTLGNLFVVIVNYQNENTLQLHAIFARGIFHYGEPPSQGVEMIERRMKKEKRLLLFLPILILFLGMIIITTVLLDMDKTQVINGVNNRLVVPIYTPFDSHQGLSYFAMLGLTSMSITFSASTIACASFTYAVVSQRLLTQLKILRWSVTNVEKRARKLAERSVESADFQRYLVICLKRNVEHFSAIRKYYLLFTEGLANLMILFSFSVGTIVIALSMIILQESNDMSFTMKLLYGGLVLCEVSNMLLLCIFGERITAECTDLFDDLYFIRWYEQSPEFRKLLLRFKFFIGKPLKYKVGGFIVANLDTFVTIMKTAYSYYNLLRLTKGHR